MGGSLSFLEGAAWRLEAARQKTMVAEIRCKLDAGIARRIDREFKLRIRNFEILLNLAVEILIKNGSTPEISTHSNKYIV